MANVYVSNIAVPRVARNKRIYGGNSFVSQNQQTIGGGVAAKHFEHGKLTGLTSRTVVVYFTAAFNSKPVMINLKIYRMIENIPVAGKWVIQDVLHYFDDDVDWITTDGFSVFIDDSEDLTGVIIEYCFTE